MPNRGRRWVSCHAASVSEIARPVLTGRSHPGLGNPPQRLRADRRDAVHRRRERSPGFVRVVDHPVSFRLFIPFRFGASKGSRSDRIDPDASASASHTFAVATANWRGRRKGSAHQPRGSFARPAQAQPRRAHRHERGGAAHHHVAVPLRRRAGYAYHSSASGRSTAPEAATSSTAAPARIRFTGTSSFLPVSVRGMAGAMTIASGTWRAGRARSGSRRRWPRAAPLVRSVFGRDDERHVVAPAGPPPAPATKAIGTSTGAPRLHGNPRRSPAVRLRGSASRRATRDDQRSPVARS